MMLKTVSMLRQSLGLQGVIGSKSTRFLGSLYPRLAVGLLAFASVTVITLTPPITLIATPAQAQERTELEFQIEAKNALDRGDLITFMRNTHHLARKGNAQARWTINNLSRVLPQSILTVLEEQMAEIFNKGQAAFNMGEHEEALKILLPLVEINHIEAKMLVDKIKKALTEQANAPQYSDECFQGLLGRSEDAVCPGAPGTLGESEYANLQEQYFADAFASAEVKYHAARVAGENSGNYDIDKFNRVIAELEPLAEQGYTPAQKLLQEIEELLGSVGGGSLAQMRAEYERWRSLGGWRFDVLRPLAEQGYGPAQYRMGRAYYAGGGGLARNRATAREWWRKAAQTLPQQAEAGDDLAQLYLGWLYYDGVGGLAENKATACSWFRKSAAQGNESAQWWVDNRC